jgi:hypothetical protein
MRKKDGKPNMMEVVSDSEEQPPEEKLEQERRQAWEQPEETTLEE